MSHPSETQSPLGKGGDGSMNTMLLLEAMTNIDGALIENAQPKRKKANKSITRIILLAALIAALTMTA